MKLLRFYSFSVAGLCLATLARSANPVDAALDLRLQAPAVRVERAAPLDRSGPMRYWSRDPKEWDRFPLEPAGSGVALGGQVFTWKAGGASVTFQPSLIATEHRADIHDGLLYTWANKLSIDWKLSAKARFYLKERAYVYAYKQAGAVWPSDYYANPVFENVVTAGVEWRFTGGVVARLPVHLQQRQYGECEGARYSGRLRNWLWISPEVSIPVAPGSELLLSFTTDTFVSSRTGRWYWKDAFTDGTVEATFKMAL